MDIIETFKDIKGFEGLYQVSNLGRVKSLKHWDGDGLNERFLKPFNNWQHYPMVTFYKEGKVKCMKMHRVMAEAFLENPDNLPHINHKDSDRTNFQLSNLEFCSVSHNMKHSYEKGGRKGAWLGKKFSDEHREKLAQKGKMGGNSRARQAIEISSLTVYSCGKEAAIENGVPYNSLKNMLDDPLNIHGIMWLETYNSFYGKEEAL